MNKIFYLFTLIAHLALLVCCEKKSTELNVIFKVDFTDDSSMSFISGVSIIPGSLNQNRKYEISDIFDEKEKKIGIKVQSLSGELIAMAEILSDKRSIKVVSKHGIKSSIKSSSDFSSVCMSSAGFSECIFQTIHP